MRRRQQVWGIIGPKRRKDIRAKGNEDARVGGGKPPLYEVGQVKVYDTRELPGTFKVSLPHG